MLFKKLTLTGLFVGCLVWGQAQLSDDFSDGDFTAAPAWTGSTGVYVVNPSLALQLNNTVAATTYLSTPYAAPSLDNFQWNIYTKQVFAPSGANYGRIYLASDQADLTGPLNGYFLQLGEAGSLDAIELFRQDGLTLTSVCRGTDASIAASFTVRIKVLRDATGLWELYVDHTGGTAYTLEASGTDNTHTSSAHFGMLATYTLSNATKFHYDDVYMGPEILDLAPPVLVSATPVSSNGLDVLFNEPLDAVSAQNTANYLVNPAMGAPATATPDGSNPNLVHLAFTPAFVNLTPYTLVVDNVADAALNAIDNDTVSFLYFVPDTAFYREVVINELMADESPQVGLPAAEFIELYNPSGKAFDLGGWTLSDGSSTATFPSAILAPGQLLIVCAAADTALFSPFGPTLGVGSFPSLNNSGDNVVLKNNLGTLIDQVAYTLDWYHNSVKDDGGWTLEQVNPLAVCLNEANWSASNNAAGGTPGTANSILDLSPDTNPPVIAGITVTAPDSLLVAFSEEIDTSALGPLTLAVSGGSGISVVSFAVTPGLKQMIVVLGTDIDTGTAYLLFVNNVSDCSGNTGNTVNAFTIPFPAGYRSIVINEFLADESPQVGLPAAEFIELYNNSTDTWDLYQWTLGDGSTTATLGHKLLGPGQYLIICAPADTNDYKLFGNVLGVTGLPSLNNTGDNIILRNYAGGLVDAIAYTDDWYNDAAKNDGGWSIEQIDPHASCHQLSVNWHASLDAAGGTPGTVNSVNSTTSDTLAPYMTAYDLVSGTTIILQFSEPLDTLSVVPAAFTVSGGIAVSAAGMTGTGFDRVMVTFATPVDSGVVYNIKATVTGCDGNGLGSPDNINFVLAFQARPGDIIINEVLFDPVTGTDDFVEVYNNASRIVNLRNWAFANIDNDTIDNHELISTTDLLLEPGAYYAFTTKKTALLNQYPLAATTRVLQIPDLPTYNNDSGTVVLINNLNRISDRFSYTAEMHFALLETVDGVSLERLDFNRPSADAGNWHSASQAAGFATPGYQNSQYNPGATNGDALTLNEMFSPDNDGYQDVINFSYAFEEAGYVGNLTLYDSRGREVKKLVRNELLGTSGTFTWDGITDRSEKAPIGIYVVYFEYFNLAGSLHKIKKSFVLAGKF